MVHFLRLISAAAIVSVSSAAPMLRREDSAIGAEVPVSAPNGIPMSDPPTSDATSSVEQPPSTTWSSSSTAWASSSVTSSSESSYQTSSTYGGSSYGGSSSSYGGSYGSSSYQPPSGGSYEPPSSTETSSAAWSETTYGSGSSSYGGSYGGGYNDCVQQCAASYSMPAATWTPPTATESSSLNIGGPVGSNGVTHTIIVAPTQGVLRFVPFSTNATVGDTLEFHWGANTHTVTQSSALEVCNKTDSPTAFASGTHDKGTVYSQVVNDTKPIWFYCGTPTHCEKGMFGGVNIGANSETGTTTSYTPLSQYVSNITSSNPDMMATWMYTKNQTSGNAFASGWGMGTDCSNMNDEQRANTLENVLYNQIAIHMNPSSVQGNVFKANNAMTFPGDLTALLANANATSPSNMTTPSGSASGSAAPAASSGASTAGTTTKNGAGALVSPSIVVGFVAIAATFFSL
ncbi:hypothetical protein BU17DRAFT_65574 [Hysterangium stoloniferum]|nr:hypothetical protein BU17DRAFT_65574 [Hysterangium stoloniferum]